MHFVILYFYNGTIRNSFILTKYHIKSGHEHGKYLYHYHLRELVEFNNFQHANEHFDVNYLYHNHYIYNIDTDKSYNIQRIRHTERIYMECFV